MTDSNVPDGAQHEPEGNNDWWAEQEMFGAPLTPEEQAKVDEMKNPADWVHDSIDASEVEKTEAQWDAEDAERDYQKRTNDELRTMAIREEEAGKRKRSRKWMEEAGYQVPDAGEAMKHFVRASNQAAQGAKKLGETIKDVGKAFAAQVKKDLTPAKKAYVPEPHLTYRPFHTPEMVELRKNLQTR